MHSNFKRFLAFYILNFFVKTTPSLLTKIPLVFLVCLSTFSVSAFSNNSINPTSSKQKDELINSNFDRLQFSQLSTLDGLSNSNVFDIVQDHQGFIWFATEDGLNRFDGNNFISYRHNDNDKHSIADNFVRKIFIDSKNTLWIGTQNGLSRYNVELDNFDNYFNEANNESSLKDNMIWDIYQNTTNTTEDFPLLWVSTSEGIHSLSLAEDNKNIRFKRIVVKNYNQYTREIKTIFQDKQQNYWLGSYDKGIHLLSSNLNYIGSLNKQNKFNLSVNANALYDMKEIDNNYWLATNNGLYIIDDRYRLVSHFTAEKDHADNPKTLLSNNIRAIEQLDENQIWLATQNGLNTINLLNNQIETYQSTKDSKTISDNWLMDIFLDKNSNMWLGSYGGGINKYSPLTSLFHHELASDGEQSYRVESFAETSDGTIWFTTEQKGLFKLLNSNEIKHEKLKKDHNFRQVLPSSNNNLWLYTKNRELFNYSIQTNVLTEHKKWAEKADFTNSKYLTIIKDDIFYINDSGILTAYNTHNEKFTSISLPLKHKLLNIHKDNNDKLWVMTTDNEVFTYNQKTSLFKNEKISIPKSFNKGKDGNLKVSENWLWLGSEAQGIVLFNRQSDQITRFNINNNLKDNRILSIEIDNKENIWLANNTGISVINPASKKIRHFDKDFGIDTPQLFDFSTFKTSKNHLIFGSPNGFYQFNPENLLQIKQNISQPVFTNLYVVNKKIKVKSDSNLTNESYSINKQLNSLEIVELAYKQSPISFEFTSPNSKLPNQIKYRYRLVGLEKNWVDAATETGRINNRATYTNLSPGNYIFEVQAFDINEPSKVKTSQLNVSILPPWWLANSMLVVYGLLSLLFISYIFQQYRNKQLYNTQIRESEERLKLSLWGSGDEMWDWNIITDKIYRSNIWGILDFPQDGTRNKINKSDDVGKIHTKYSST